MRRIRVMHVVTRLNVGGPAIYVDLLSSRLDPDRFETLVVAGREGPREGSMVELGRFRAGDAVMRVESLSRDVSGPQDFRAIAAVTGIARSFKPDIVHTHLTKAGFVGRIAARLGGVPAIVHTFHGLIFHGYFGRWESALYLNIERALARLTTRVIAITPGQRRELLRLGLGPARRIDMIPIGIDLDPFLRAPERGRARAALGLPQDVPVVVLVARLVHIKDVGSFLRALALLRQQRPDVIGIVVGDGQERSKLESLAETLDLRGSCRFLGWRSDMPTVYAACDVLALSSLNEGTPTSVIEAMAAARPVVATAVGAVPEVIEDDVTGVLVPAADPPALAAALASVLGDPERAERLASVARRRVYPAYDATALVSSVEELYVRLVGA